MLDLTKHDGPSPKCYFATTALPTFVNHEQPSTKKKPFSVVLNHRFSHTLDVVVPKDLAEQLNGALRDGAGTLRYARVNMKLSELIEGDFFNHYIKTGNVLMLSKGRLGVDQSFSLAEGILHLEVGKATYERLGLVGKVMRTEGRKHVKARFEIDINLRLPNMIHGKKGFERVVWAFKNVLDHSLTWLFCDLRAPTDDTGPISEHHPTIRAIHPTESVITGAKVPVSLSGANETDADQATELLEWLQLVNLDSPRVCKDDRMDPFLSRYSVHGSSMQEEVPGSVQDLVGLHWKGFISPTFTTKILLATMKTCGNGWFAMSACSFDDDGYTILKTGNRALTWEQSG